MYWCQGLGDTELSQAKTWSELSVINFIRMKLIRDYEAQSLSTCNVPIITFIRNIYFDRGVSHTCMREREESIYKFFTNVTLMKIA